MIEQVESQTRINRRQFLVLAWAASLAALLGQAGFALLKFLQPRAKVGEFGRLVVAGQVAEFPPGSVRHVPEGQFYISHVQDYGLIAMWHRCTHLGCTVPWNDVEALFLCPCHSSLFNSAGEVLGGPAPRPLDLFPIEIVDDEVVVDTSQPIERQSFEPIQATKI